MSEDRSVETQNTERERAYAYALESWVVEAESLLGGVEMVHQHTTGAVSGFCPACMGMGRLRSAVATVKEHAVEEAS